MPVKAKALADTTASPKPLPRRSRKEKTPSENNGGVSEHH